MFLFVFFVFFDLNVNVRAETKLSSLPCGYTLQEAQAIMAELRNIQHSLSSGEKEKAELMASLSRLRDDLTRLKPLNNDMSPDLSTLSLPQEKFSTASQTDLSGREKEEISPKPFHFKSPILQENQPQLGHA